MSIDPLKRIPKREEQLKTEPKNHKGIKLYDIDSAIAEHMIDTVMPTVEVMGEKVKVPVVYGNPERWKAIKKDGFLRDRNGQVQIPICVGLCRGWVASHCGLRNGLGRWGQVPVVMLI